MSKSQTVKVGNHEVEISSLDKVLFPDEGVAKGDVIEYYSDIAELALPYLEDRALTFKRYPDGLKGEGFYQKHAPDYAPDWIKRVDFDKREGGSMTQLSAHAGADLVWMANNAGILVIHAPLARTDKPDHPDVMVFDLDPSEDYSDTVRKVALELKGILEERDLKSFVKTTGSRGFHICVPLRRDHDFQEMRDESRRIAKELEEHCPDATTTQHRKNKRGGKIFIDTYRNAYGQTRVAPYSLRARDSAPIACPLDWDELKSSDLHPQQYTIKNIRQRLGQKTDPWADFLKTHNRLKLTDQS